MFPYFHILTLLFHLRRQQLKNEFHSLLRKGRLRLIAIVFTLLALWLGLFWGFYRSFIFMGSFLGLGEILIDRLIFLLSLALFLMLIFSNAVISFQLHYKARETGYFQSLPLPHSTIFWFLLLETVFLSTWASLFLIFPVALAYGISHNLPLYSYLAFPLFGFCLAGLAAMLGALLAALITRLLALAKSKVILVILILLIAFLAAFGSKFPLIERETPDQQIYLVNNLFKHTRISLHPLLPSFWAADGFLQFTKGGIRRSLGFLMVLAVNFLFFSQIVDLIAGNSYHRAWSLYHSRRQIRKREGISRRKGAGKNFLFFLRPEVQSLLLKDLKIFIREPAQWIQGAILFGLLAIYIANIKDMPTNVYQPFWKNLITFFNLGATSLILATLTTRFVFPSLSLEGRTFWILGLAPLPRSTLFRVKFWSSFIGALIVTESLMLLSNHILEVSGMMMIVTCGAVFLMALVMVSLAMGLGAIFPDFKQDSPARIAAGFGGTLNLILSLVYIVIVVGSLALASHLKIIRSPGGTIYFSKSILAGIVALILLSFLATYIPFKLGIKALNRLQF